MRMEDWVKFLRIKGDCDRAKIIKFMMLWMQYNSWYNVTYADLNTRTNNGRTRFPDRQKALELSLHNAQAVNVYDIYFKNDFVSSFEKVGSFHCNKGERDKLWADHPWENEVEFNNKLPENSELKRYLELIYQLRCNFFHGSKEYDEYNVELIVWAYNTFSKFLNKLEVDGIINLEFPTAR